MLSHLRSMCEKAVKSVRNERGQGLVEYALILVLIAIVVMVAVQNVGHSTNNAFTNINSSLNAK